MSGLKIIQVITLLVLLIFAFISSVVALTISLTRGENPFSPMQLPTTTYSQPYFQLKYQTAQIRLFSVMLAGLVLSVLASLYGSVRIVVFLVGKGKDETDGWYTASNRVHIYLCSACGVMGCIPAIGTKLSIIVQIYIPVGSLDIKDLASFSMVLLSLLLYLLILVLVIKPNAQQNSMVSQKIPIEEPVPLINSNQGEKGGATIKKKSKVDKKAKYQPLLRIVKNKQHEQQLYLHQHNDNNQPFEHLLKKSGQSSLDQSEEESFPYLPRSFVKQSQNMNSPTSKMQIPKLAIHKIPSKIPEKKAAPISLSKLDISDIHPSNLLKPMTATLQRKNKNDSAQIKNQNVSILGLMNPGQRPCIVESANPLRLSKLKSELQMSNRLANGNTPPNKSSLNP